jgi:hypothetical protein
MVAPVGDLAAFELPALNPRVLALLRGSQARLAVDVGGSVEGIRILRALGEFLPDEGLGVYLVVNPYRPYSRTAGQIRASYERINAAMLVQGGRAASETDHGYRPATLHHQIEALVSNPHLGRRTDKGVVLRGHKIVVEAARTLGARIDALCVLRALADQIRDDADGLEGVPVYEIDLHLRPPWERSQSDGEDAGVGQAQDQRRTVQGL